MFISQTWVTNLIHSYLTASGEKELHCLSTIVTIRLIKILRVVSIFHLTKWTYSPFYSLLISPFRTVNNFKLLNGVVSLTQRKNNISNGFYRLQFPAFPWFFLISSIILFSYQVIAISKKNTTSSTLFLKYRESMHKIFRFLKTFL